MFTPFLRPLLACTALFSAVVLMAQERTLPPFDAAHMGAGVEVSAGSVLKADQYEKKWMLTRNMQSVGAFVRIHTLPADSSAFAEDFGFPTFSFGLLYGNYSGVRMRKSADPDWGMAVPVDYTSQMGHTFTLFANFERPLWRKNRWSIGYSLGTGLGYATKPYDKDHNVDNETLGSKWNIFFDAGAFATFQVHRHWAVRGAIHFRHLSNGATARPNKGANTIEPALSLLYTPELPTHYSRPTFKRPHERYFYGNVAVGIGGKTLLDHWLRTQYCTPPTEPNYRTGRFHFYPSYSIQANAMYRYARRWASGLGLDLNYANAAKGIEALDAGTEFKHSPWSVGIAARHEVFYGQLSMSASIGVYLLRRMGSTAAWEEKPYYERIGLRYHFSKKKGFFVGAEVKAHSTKADFTELLLGWEF